MQRKIVGGRRPYYRLEEKEEEEEGEGGTEQQQMLAQPWKEARMERDIHCGNCVCVVYVWVVVRV